MDKQDPIQRQLTLLAEHIAGSKDVVLDAWHQRVTQDPTLSVASRLSYSQFVNHMPHVLDALCNKLRAWPKPLPVEAQAEFPTGSESHSRHRWRWGYDLTTLAQEWGYLNECLVEFTDGYGRRSNDFDLAALAEAHQVVAGLVRESISQNVSEYSALLQSEAAARVRDLQATLEQVRDMEQARGELLRAATHDLRGSLGIVTGSVALMEDERLGQATSEQVTRLRRGVHSLQSMLTKLMDMSRLEAGQERLELASFDAAQVLSELCSTSQALADARGLQLEMNGPQSLPVVGDEVKLRRIVQNLLLNSLKYTEQGGVVVAWAPAEVARWSLSITDTGPGFDPGLAPFVDKLQDGDGPLPLSPQPAKQGNVQRGIPKASAQGEGVGLTIVKRLCELLDAALELETKPGAGTTFRVIFPMSYD